jgi:hypothetical protein
MIVHLCCCLITAQTAFLAGIDKTSKHPDCRIVAGIIQFSLLAAFMVCFSALQSTSSNPL